MSSRRDFLGDLWRGTGGALLAGSAFIVHRALRAAAPPARETILPAETVSRAIAEGGAPVEDLFVAGPSSAPMALSLVCTHLGCRGFEEDIHRFLEGKRPPLSFETPRSMAAIGG